MKERKLSNQHSPEDKSPERAPGDAAVLAADQPRRGARAWLFGAYAFLFVWGVAYLVLLFTNRLPI